MFTIRPMHYTDVDALIEIAQVAFAQEFLAQGFTAEGLAKQAKFVARGRMIPFKLLAKLSGIQWEIFVAEMDGMVVGCGGYSGKQQMTLANLMVHPSYRRQGIGQALLEKRLQSLREKSIPLVTVTVLDTNLPSLGNLQKQGFTLFDSYTVFEAALPLPPLVYRKAPIQSRSILTSDIVAFKHLECLSKSEEQLKIQGSYETSYFPSWTKTLWNTLEGSMSWSQVFLSKETPIGFLTAYTSKTVTKGRISRPILAPNHEDALPEMVYSVSQWLHQQGKEVIRLVIPTQNDALSNLLDSKIWHKTYTWLQLVKYLS